MSNSSRVLVLTIGMVALQVTPSRAQAAAAGVDAEIETTYTLAEGRQITTHGHYYRSRGGMVREDSPLGAIITDTKSHTLTLLSTEAKEARVIKMPATDFRGARPKNIPATVPFGEGIVEGHQVTKSRRSDGHGEVHEIWAAKDLGLIVLSKTVSPNLTMTKTLRNVLVHEPDPSVFQVPRGYTVVEDSLPPEFANAGAFVPDRAGTPAIPPKVPK